MPFDSEEGGSGSPVRDFAEVAEFASKAWESEHSDLITPRQVLRPFAGSFTGEDFASLLPCPE